uniref:Odorant receptor n=1 Tax=Lutzomyia longipalpis TaxID=7200 RepID=A0A7G3ASG6_LUTLO
MVEWIFLLRDITKPITLMGYTMITVVLTADVCLFYSMYRFLNDFKDLAFLLTTSGIAIIVNQKMYVMYTMNHSVHRIIEEVNIILERTSKHPDQANEMHKGMKVFGLAYKVIYLSYRLTVILMLSSSMAASIYTNEKNLIIGHVVPYFDHKTTPGYEINYVFHLCQLYICLVIVLSFDICFYGHIFIACSHKLAMIHYFHELDRLTEESDDVSHNEEIEECLKGLITEHQSHVIFMTNLADFTSMSNFTVLSSSMCSIIFTIYVLIEFFWVPGFVFIVPLITQLMVFGAVGTVYVIYAELYEAAIYNCKWYALPPRAQKALAFILMMSQSPILVTVGGYAPLDLQAFVAVCI